MSVIRRIGLWSLVTGCCLLVGTAQASQTYYNHYRYNGRYYGPDEDGVSTKYRDAAYKAHDADMKVYNSAHPAWESQKEAYNEYVEAKKGYDQREAEYKKNKAEWERLTGSSGVGVVLDLNSYPENDRDKRIVTKLTEAVEVPQFSDISTYRNYCQGYVCANGVKGGSLTCENKYFDDSGVHQISFTHSQVNREECWSSGKGGIYSRDEIRFYMKEKETVEMTRTVASQHVSGGYANGVRPFTDSQGEVSDRCEKDSLILIGTYKYPIEINGPVYVDGDVVIRGFVKGQGSIYAGRNIHVIGDITYYDPPSWPHDVDELKKAENKPDKVKEANKSKDLLLLAARGNIIVGDYTSVEWTNATQMSYLDLNRSGMALKSCTTSEPDIGYSSGYPKNRNYASEDGGQAVCEQEVVTNGPDKTGFVDGGGIIPRSYYIKTITYATKSRNRKYYESSVGNIAIQELKQTSAVVGTQPSWRDSSTLWRRLFAAIGSYRDTQTVTDNTDSGDVTEIDAILYANHGIFGVAGGSVNKRLHLNGAMICRDEGLLTSFAGRFADDQTAKAWINWDMRIKSDLDGSVHIGAPEKESGTSGIRIKSVTWSYAR